MPSRAGNRAFPREIDTLRRHFTLHQAGYFGVSIETRGLSCSFLLPSEDATLQRHHGDDRPGRAFSIDARFRITVSFIIAFFKQLTLLGRTNVDASRIGKTRWPLDSFD